MLRFAAMSTVHGFVNVSCVVTSGIEKSPKLVLAPAVLEKLSQRVMHWAQTH